jgi:hypothetical protein
VRHDLLSPQASQFSNAKPAVSSWQPGKIQEMMVSVTKIIFQHFYVALEELSPLYLAIASDAVHTLNIYTCVNKGGSIPVPTDLIGAKTLLARWPPTEQTYDRVAETLLQRISSNETLAPPTSFDFITPQAYFDQTVESVTRGFHDMFNQFISQLDRQGVASTLLQAEQEEIHAAHDKAEQQTWQAEYEAHAAFDRAQKDKARAANDRAQRHDGGHAFGT